VKERSVMRNEDDVGGRARVTRDMRSECCEEVEHRLGYEDTTEVGWLAL